MSASDTSACSHTSPTWSITLVFQRPTPTGTGTRPRQVPPTAAAKRDGSTYAVVEFGMPSEKLWKSAGGTQASTASADAATVTTAKAIAPRSRRSDHQRQATTSASDPAS